MTAVGLPRWQVGPRRRVLRFAGLVALGVVAATGQAPLGFWPLTIVALALAMLWLREERRIWGAFAGTWALGVGYFGATLHWIVEPFFVDAARDAWMAPFGLIFMAGGMALFWGLAGLLARALGPRSISLTGLVAGLSAVEILRSLILTGFPWALLGHIWIDTPMARIAAFLGPHGLTLLTLGLAAAAATLLSRHRRPAGRLAAVLSGVALLAVVTGTTTPIFRAVPTVPDPDAPVIRIVQPNAIQSQKWEPGMAQVFYDRLLRYTSDGDVPDLVVWPETAIQYLFERSQREIEGASDAARGAPLITGIVRGEAAPYYNSLIVLTRGGILHDLYDKWHLVPFGEYFPFAGTLNGWGLGALTGLVGGGYALGPGPGSVSIPGVGRAVALICYEGIFAEEVNVAAAGPERPRLVVLITNDAWFGDWAGPAQHFAQARLRAIEQGLPVVRAANTGISGMIDGNGRVVSSLPLGTEGALDAPLPPALAAPPYTRFGDGPAVILTLLLAIASVAVSRRRVAAIG